MFERWGAYALCIPQMSAKSQFYYHTQARAIHNKWRMKNCGKLQKTNEWFIQTLSRILVLALLQQKHSLRENRCWATNNNRIWISTARKQTSYGKWFFSTNNPNVISFRHFSHTSRLIWPRQADAYGTRLQYLLFEYRNEKCIYILLRSKFTNECVSLRIIIGWKTFSNKIISRVQQQFKENFCLVHSFYYLSLHSLYWTYLIWYVWHGK